MLKRSFAVLWVVFVLAAPSVFSQIEEQVNVGVIEVWAKVTDGKHQVVTDLQPQDFSILIDGKKADLRCFDRTFETAPPAITTPAEDAESQPFEPTPSREKRTFIFFFDLLHSSARDIDFLKGRIMDFLHETFRDDDQGIVFALLPSVNLGVVQKMTSNRDALISVVRKMNGNPVLEKRVRNNEKELLDVLYAFNSTAGNSNLAGGQQGANSRAAETITQARGLARTFAAQEKNLSKITLNSFLTIADYLSATQYTGRPVMIYVSGGFSLRPGQNYFEIVQKAIEDTYVRGTEENAYWDIPTDNDFEVEVKKAIGLLNRMNITIYSIDANGLATYGTSPELDNRQAVMGPDRMAYNQELQDSLAMVSRETGGLAFLSSNNFVRGMAEITSDMNQQYWLCATLPPSPKRGTYHRIEVKIDREDVDVRHRQGYVD